MSSITSTSTPYLQQQHSGDDGIRPVHVRQLNLTSNVRPMSTITSTSTPYMQDERCFVQFDWVGARVSGDRQQQWCDSIRSWEGLRDTNSCEASSHQVWLPMFRV
jgi:hypothetical protein